MDTKKWFWAGSTDYWCPWRDSLKTEKEMKAERALPIVDGDTYVCLDLSKLYWKAYQ